MRILYITHTNIWGGANVALFNIIKLMQLRGHQCFVLTDSNYGPFLDKLEQLHCPYYQCKLMLNIYPQIRQKYKWIRFLKRLILSMLYFPRQKKYANRLIREISPDIVHTNVGPLDVAVDACEKMNIPHVWHMREYQDLDFGMHFFPSRKSFHKKICSKGNWNISITQGVFNHHHLRNGIDAVIYDGVFSNDVLKKQKDSEKEDYILFVGRIDEAKAPFDLIRVFPQFLRKYPQYRLLLAGTFKEGDMYKECCDNFIRKNKLQDSIIFLGERNDIYDLMSKARALVVTSRFEGFGFISVEAMLNNCVVIGRDTGGTKEQFDIGEVEVGEPIAFRFKNDRELLQRLDSIVNEDTSRMRFLAKRTVLNHYTIESHVNKIENFYQRIISCCK